MSVYSLISEHKDQHTRGERIIERIIVTHHVTWRGRVRHRHARICAEILGLRGAGYCKRRMRNRRAGDLVRYDELFRAFQAV